MEAIVIEPIYANSSPAPKEWAEIPEIKKVRPIGDSDNVSLQQLEDAPELKGRSVCQWWVVNRQGIGWVPASPCFEVKQ